jgi:hypothetical protein
MNKKIAISTWCTDNYQHFLGLQGLINSIKYFHPEIECVVYDSNKTQYINQKYPWATWIKMMPPTMIDLFDDYDMVIHVDADSTIVGSLDEVLLGDFDVACVRNYTHKGSCGTTPFQSILSSPHLVPGGFNINNFMNAGFVATTSKEFVLDWMEANRICAHDSDEQMELNRIINTDKYKVKVLDDIGSGVSYGVSNIWGTTTHWDSWKKLYVKNDKLYIINELEEEIEVKVLHVAGGGDMKRIMFGTSTMREWLNNWVPNDVKEYLNNITK